jgi:hypothetical protein
VAKKVGSNYSLFNRRLSANLDFAFAALPPTSVGARAAPTPDSISFLVTLEGWFDKLTI